MRRTRRRVLAGGLGLAAAGGLASAGGADSLHDALAGSPRAWRVSTVYCDEPIVEGYDGERVYATLITSQQDARERLVDTECFDPTDPAYRSLDYDEFVVSVRTAVLPADQKLETVSYEFDGEVLRYAVAVTDAEGGDGATDDGASADASESAGDSADERTMRHVVTTWELDGARPPDRIELTVDDGRN